MKLRKRILLLLLALCLLPLPAIRTDAAAEKHSTDDFSYIVNDNGKVTIRSYSGSSNFVVVPSSLGGKPVSDVGDGVFASHTEIVSVVIQSGVEKLGERAFAGCTSLTSLSLPDSIVSVGASAFSGCTSLAHIGLGRGLTGIGASAFSGCTALRQVILPAATVSVGGSAFAGCKNLRKVAVRSEKTTFGSNCFGGASAELVIYALPGSPIHKMGQKTVVASDASECKFNNVLNGTAIKDCTTSVVAIILPESVNGRSIIGVESNAFTKCSSLEAVILPDSVITIGDSAFRGLKKLSFVNFPAALSGNLGTAAFENCTSLRRVEMEGCGIVSLQPDSFSGCSALEYISLPSTLTRISSRAFYNCTSLRSIVFFGGQPECANIDSTLQLVSFGGVVGAEVYATADAGWSSLSGGKWYPNGRWRFEGFNVTVSAAHDCFYVEKIESEVTCHTEGRVIYTCPACGDSYTDVTPMTDHVYATPGIFDGIETFRCKYCTASYTVFHLDSADISIESDTSKQGVEVIKKVILMLGGLNLTEGEDFIVSKEYIAELGRIKLTLTGIGNCTGTQTHMISEKTGKIMRKYIVSSAGLGRDKEYYPGDTVTVSSNAPENATVTWSIFGTEAISQTNEAIVFIMPESNVTVIANIDLPETDPTTDTTTEPVTTPPETDPPVTTPEETTPEETTPEETTPVSSDTTKRPDETTVPYNHTGEAKGYIIRGIAWGVLLVISLGGFVTLAVISLKKKD